MALRHSYRVPKNPIRSVNSDSFGHIKAVMAITHNEIPNMLPKKLLDPIYIIETLRIVVRYNYGARRNTIESLNSN